MYYKLFFSFKEKMFIPLNCKTMQVLLQICDGMHIVFKLDVTSSELRLLSKKEEKMFAR